MAYLGSSLRYKGKTNGSKAKASINCQKCLLIKFLYCTKCKFKNNILHNKSCWFLSLSESVATGKQNTKWIAHNVNLKFLTLQEIQTIAFAKKMLFSNVFSTKQFFYKNLINKWLMAIRVEKKSCEKKNNTVCSSLLFRAKDILINLRQRN